MPSNSATYTPTPWDLDSIEIPAELLPLVDALAENVHEVWSAGRISEGWSFGPARDDEALHNPCLIPFKDLTDDDKAYDVNTAVSTIKAVLASGFAIVKDDKNLRTAQYEGIL